jgi:gas vesicle protein GvpO
MAEERVERVSPARAKPRRAAGRRGERKPASRAQVAANARRQLSEITGMEPGIVTSLEPWDARDWKVTVEMVELARIPRSADMLGVYEVTLNANGALQEYRRVARYARGEPGGRADV